MAEELDEEIASAPSGGSGGVNPAALDAALQGTAAHTEEARDFLRRQSALTDMQSKILHEQHAFELSHLKWRRFNDQMKGALQIMLVALGLLIAVLIAAAMWNARQADGIVVEAFSVPAAFGANGTGGDIVAEDVTNKISVIRLTANGNSFAESKDVERDRSDDIKVDIPETGISLGEAWRYLKSWLGHERSLQGNVRSLPDGKIALTVVLAGDAPATFAGGTADLGTLEQEAAEHVFASVDPGNYVLYLDAMGRPKDADAAAWQFVQSRTDQAGRSGALSLLAAMTRDTDLRMSLERARLSLALYSGTLVAHREIMVADVALGHDEEVLSEAQKLQSVRPQDLPPAFRGAGYTQLVSYVHLTQEVGTGDFLRAQTEQCFYCSFADSFLQQAIYAARSHDPALSRTLIARAIALGPVSPAALHLARYYERASVDDWRAATSEARDYRATLSSSEDSPRGDTAAKILTIATPMGAEAMAKNGNISIAQSSIESTPRDCYHCVRVRGIVAVLRGNPAEAARWFATATILGPSLPFAYTDWGVTLLRKGDYDRAIEKFREANRKGPHFADPLEMWSEALMQENRSDLALAKFEEANKYAPNWGRLHLEWGKALYYAGKTDEAKKQLEIASRLDLSASERANLLNWTRRHG